VELERYIPELLRYHLSTDPAAITSPRFVSSPSAVLLADISGFTPLAERLSAQGPVGAEQLTGFLNS
jgi:class 3 adenylate cyclase